MRDKLIFIMAPDYNGKVYAKAVYEQKPNLGQLWKHFTDRTKEAEAWKESVGYYNPGNHSQLKTGNSETLKLIEDEQL